MRRLWLAALVSALGLGFADAAQGATAVHPSVARDLKPIELSQLILMLLPPKDAREVPWSYMHSSRSVFRWGVEDPDHPGEQDQNAFSRVRVNGRAFYTTSRGRREEIAWRIHLARTSSKSAAGPTVITIEPEESQCFSKLRSCPIADGEGLKGAPLHAWRFCSYGWPDNHSTAYVVTLAGKHLAIVTYNVSEGSGGRTNWIEVELFRDGYEVCKDLRDLSP